jgi:hypothetical protein
MNQEKNTTPKPTMLDPKWIPDNTQDAVVCTCCYVGYPGPLLAYIASSWHKAFNHTQRVMPRA